MKLPTFEAESETFLRGTPDPCNYPRRVLLAVCGLSPQIVTETLYALATQSDEAGASFIPTEVHLITTVEGALRAKLSLLSDEPGWFRKLCADYQLRGISFDAGHIHVMRNSQGHEMDDIRTGEDNRDAANFITAQVRAITADAACALHVSIAGGRKTMGFYLGYALSLYGRVQDRLSHVLVSAPFESNWNFFYPTPYSRVLEMKDGKLADTATARVSLAEIPFVSLRHGLSAALLASDAGFDDTVKAARQALAPPHLTLDLPGRCIRAGERVLKLPPAELALLAVFARRASQGQAPLAAPAGRDVDWAARYLDEYSAIMGVMGVNDATLRALKNGMDGDYFSTRKCKLVTRLTAQLGTQAAAYRIDDGGTRPRRYSLMLPAGAVVFVTHKSLEETQNNDPT